MAEYLSRFFAGLYDFLFYYPLFMAYLWMAGALIYFRHWESGKHHQIENEPGLPEHPPVSFIIPCFNEEEHIAETIEYLIRQDYPNFEAVAVDDGSTDNTWQVLEGLCAIYPQLRIVRLAENKGKAEALRTAALMARNEYLICIDGDALLDYHAATWIMSHFLSGPRVGAVTGNPRIRTRSTLLGRIQVGEFSAIVGMIKRAQRIYGRVFTISGVVAGFRKTALHQVGYWRQNTVTDDIDISWRLQMNHWDIRFEPNALCWILMPETFRGLWRQRLRWSQGGMEALLEYAGKLFKWRERRMWGVVVEYFSSIFWAYSMALFGMLWIVGTLVTLPSYIHAPSLIPGWHGVILGTTCMLQFAISLMIDSRYEKGLSKNYYWLIWYPMLYWLIQVFTTVVAVPKAMLGRRRRTGSWQSPDRGLRPQ